MSKQFIHLLRRHYFQLKNMTLQKEKEHAMPHQNMLVLLSEKQSIFRGDGDEAGTALNVISDEITGAAVSAASSLFHRGASNATQSSYTFATSTRQGQLLVPQKSTRFSVQPTLFDQTQTQAALIAQQPVFSSNAYPAVL